MKKTLLFVFLTALIAITPAGAQEKVDSATIAKIRAEGLQRSQVMDVFDHLSFIAVGLPGFQAVQDHNNYDVRTHHTNMDTYERASADALKRAAVVAATVLYHAAMRGFAQKVDDVGLSRCSGGL